MKYPSLLIVNLLWFIWFRKYQVFAAAWQRNSFCVLAHSWLTLQSYQSSVHATVFHIFMFLPIRAIHSCSNVIVPKKTVDISVSEISSQTGWRFVLFCFSVAWNPIQYLVLRRCSLSIAWKLVDDYQMTSVVRPGKCCVRTIFRIPQLQIGYHSPAPVFFCSKMILHWKLFKLIMGIMQDSGGRRECGQ